MNKLKDIKVKMENIEITVGEYRLLVSNNADGELNLFLSNKDCEGMGMHGYQLEEILDIYFKANF